MRALPLMASHPDMVMSLPRDGGLPDVGAFLASVRSNDGGRADTYLR